jgi:hypothetical protein
MSHYTNRYNFWNDNKQTIVLIDPNYSSYREFENSYFKNETNFYVFFNLMRDRFNFGQDLKTLYSIFACDFEWAKKTVFCGGSSSSTSNGNTTSTIWKNFPCVTSRKDFKDGATFTYTSSAADFGTVTLNPNGTFTSTGKRNKGVWSCTKTGKIFIDDTKTTPAPVTGGGGATSTALTAEDLKNGKFVKLGMKGDIIGKIQELLISKGYKDISKDGKVDKVFGGRTKRMVKSFQSANGLTDDGAVGPLTWGKLNDSSAVAASAATASSSTTTPEKIPVISGSDAVLF